MSSSASSYSHARSQSLPPQATYAHSYRKEALTHNLGKRSSVAGSSSTSLPSTVMTQSKQGSQHHHPRSKRQSFILSGPASTSRFSLIGRSSSKTNEDEGPRLLSQNVPDLSAHPALANPGPASPASSVYSSISLIDQQRKRRAERARKAAALASGNCSTASLQSTYSTDTFATCPNGKVNRMSLVPLSEYH